MRALTLIAAGLALILGWSCRAAPTVTTGEAPLLHVVKAVESPLLVVAPGDLAPVDELSVSTPNSIYGVIDAVVPEGIKVEKGEPILIIRTQDTEREIREKSLELLRKTKELKEIELENREQLAEEDDKAKQLGINLAHAQAQLDLLTKGYQPLEIERVETDIGRARLAYDRQQRRSRAQKEMNDRGYLANLEYEKQLSELEKSVLELSKQKNALEMKHEGARHEEREKLEAEKKKLENELKLSRENLEKEAQVKKLKEEKAQAEIESARTILKESERVMKSAHVTAESTGTIIHYGDFWSPDIKVGKSVWAGQQLMGIARGGGLKVKTRVAQADIKHVVKDQKALITLPALRGGLLTGKVTQVGRTGEAADPADEKGAKMFPVTVELDGQEPRLCAGMSVRVEILVHEGKGLQRVPLDAVSTEDEKQTVRRYDPAKGLVEVVTLEPVHRDQDFLYVSKGISAGDSLVLTPPETPK